MDKVQFTEHNLVAAPIGEVTTALIAELPRWLSSHRWGSSTQPVIFELKAFNSSTPWQRGSFFRFDGERPIPRNGPIRPIVSLVATLRSPTGLTEAHISLESAGKSGTEISTFVTIDDAKIPSAEEFKAFCAGLYQRVGKAARELGEASPAVA